MCDEGWTRRRERGQNRVTARTLFGRSLPPRAFAAVGGRINLTNWQPPQLAGNKITTASRQHVQLSLRAVAAAALAASAAGASAGLRTIRDYAHAVGNHCDYARVHPRLLFSLRVLLFCWREDRRQEVASRTTKRLWKGRLEGVACQRVHV